MEQRQSAGRDWKRKALPVVLLCCAGIALNMLGVQITRWFSLPLYLDCVGTSLASVLGGYIPGILVGFFSNLLNGLSDDITIFYSLTSVLIAIVSAWFAGRGSFRKLSGLPAVVLALAAVGGGIGSVLTWFLYGGGIGEGFTAPLARSLYGSGLFSEFFAQLSADFLYDILDKAIEVLLVAGILRLLPAAVAKAFPFYGQSERKGGASGGIPVAKRFSLQHKMMGVLSVTAVTVTLVVTQISLRQYHTSIIEEETFMAYGVANTAASVFDPENVETYLTLGEAAPGYLECERRLASIAESSENIAYVYVYKIMEDGCHVVFDPDTSEGPGADPGEVIPFDQAFMEKVPDLLAGREISPTVSNETYGWLFTVYLPVRDAAGVCRCYVGVDILMRELSAKENIFLVKVFSLFLSFFIMILALAAWLVNRAVVFPINSMAEATMAFAQSLDGRRASSLARIRALDIHTGDEIENLYHAIQANAEETVQYLGDVQAKNEQITQMQNGLITVMADMVESRDQNTGNHIRNTALYVRMILERMRADGMEKETLTDAYIQDVYNSAPLHDIGKIKIPDAVLNKPGRLTEEEFTLMKTHSAVGVDIIDNAVAMMARGSAGYMAEARNVALYHHERWDGTGYPERLKGDEIPLSARVMAVADVFDALVSRRCYKEGFSFEKAIGIIKEESGTHFDPRVVQAFLECEEEVRRLAEEKADGSRQTEKSEE